MSLSWVLAIHSFSQNCITLKRRSGSRGLAIYLKACSILLMKAAAGDKIKDLRPLGVRVARTGGGVPRWVVPAHRKAVLDGSVPIVRLWLTLFGLYRVLEFTKPFSVRTITAPGPLYVDMFHEFIIRFWTMLPKPEVKPWEVLCIRKSGPLTQAGAAKGPFKGTVSVTLDRESKTRAYRQTTMSVMVLQAIQLVNAFPSLLLSLDQVQTALGEKKDRRLKYLYLDWWAKHSPGKVTFPRPLGKLGVKEEPGKKRVFAMVDYWTQVALKPLHDSIFRILRTIPQDGTFDQNAAVRSASLEMEGATYVASFDLSAATDRLPVRLQSSILDHVIPGLGEPWAALLVGRDYSIPRKYASFGRSVRYAVGQPMGALSSWAMLALTHHFLVQYAAFKSGYREWFTKYRILGDDIIIWDIGVALYYQNLLKWIGVDISFAKSLVSRNGSFEFAKRFYLRGSDCSPVSMREAAAAVSSLDGLYALLERVGTLVTPSGVLAFLGFGYKVRGGLMKPLAKVSKVTSVTLRFLAMPGKSSISFSSWSQWVMMTAIHSHSELPSSFEPMISYLSEQVRKVPTRMDGVQKLDGGGYFQWDDWMWPSYQYLPLDMSREFLSNQLEGFLLPLYKRWRNIQRDVRNRVPKFSEETTFDEAMEAYLAFVPDLTAVPRGIPQMYRRDTKEFGDLMVRRWVKVQNHLRALAFGGAIP